MCFRKISNCQEENALRRRGQGLSSLGVMMSNLVVFIFNKVQSAGMRVVKSQRQYESQVRWLTGYLVGKIKGSVTTKGITLGDKCPYSLGSTFNREYAEWEGLSGGYIGFRLVEIAVSAHYKYSYTNQCITSGSYTNPFCICFYRPRNTGEERQYCEY